MTRDNTLVVIIEIPWLIIMGMVLLFVYSNSINMTDREIWQTLLKSNKKINNSNEESCPKPAKKVVQLNTLLKFY